MLMRCARVTVVYVAYIRECMCCVHVIDVAWQLANCSDFRQLMLCTYGHMDKAQETCCESWWISWSVDGVADPLC